jgi:hypothetical protein
VMRRSIWSGTGLAAAVLISEVAITVVGLKADWARYHLPVLLLVAVCIGVVAGRLTQLAVPGIARPRDAATNVNLAGLPDLPIQMAEKDRY